MKISNLHVMKVEERGGTNQRVLLEFDADNSPKEGWPTFFVTMFKEQAKPVPGATQQAQQAVQIPQK